MNRCIKRFAPSASLAHLLNTTALVIAASFFALAAPSASAQSDQSAPNLKVREFPKDVRRGELIVGLAPEIYLDGKADRLSMGARIHDTNNLLVLPGQIINQQLLVNYVRENGGPVQQVWILNSEEAKIRVAGSQQTIWNFVTGQAAGNVTGQ